jgi:hypothetical protein
MKQFHFNMFNVIMLFHITVPNRPNINTLCTMEYCERLSVFRVDHRVQKSGHIWIMSTGM